MWFTREFQSIVEIAGRAYLCDYSMDSEQSPLKLALNSAAKNTESVHTLNVDGSHGPMKGEYEMAHNKCVAEIHEMFKPVQETTKAL